MGAANPYATMWPPQCNKLTASKPKMTSTVIRTGAPVSLARFLMSIQTGYKQTSNLCVHETHFFWTNDTKTHVGSLARVVLQCVTPSG